MNAQAGYWERGVALVPHVTGASGLMDARDMVSLAADLGFGLPLGRVLDVGCGTGRIAKHCTDYRGLDISRDAVDYCRARDIQADVIDGPDDLVCGTGYDWVVCMSVFTHIDEFDRVKYLARFARLAPRLLVDIIPGDGSGGVALWTMEPERLESLLRLSGYEIVATIERDAPEGAHVHRYYHARVK